MTHLECTDKHTGGAQVRDTDVAETVLSSEYPAVTKTSKLMKHAF